MGDAADDMMEAAREEFERLMRQGKPSRAKISWQRRIHRYRIKGTVKYSFRDTENRWQSFQAALAWMEQRLKPTER